MTLPIPLRAATTTPVAAAGRAIAVAGEPVMLHACGVAWIATADALVVADLHLEKASSFARRGSFLPPYDTGATLRRLEAAVAALRPRVVVALGDSFHDRGGPDRLAPADRARLERLTRAGEFVWITGNHDPELPPWLGGRVVDELRMGGLTLRHVPEPRARGEIGGHMHPVVSVVGGGRRVRRACFASDGDRLVMPAFGELTGGLDLASPAFADLFDRRRTTAFALGRDRLHAIPLGSFHA